MKKYQGLLAFGITTMTVSLAAGQAAFTPGNLVVFQVGTDGGAAFGTGLAVPSYLKEIQIAGGTVVQTIALPSVASPTGNRAVNTRGLSTSEGFLGRSVNGQFLTFTGFNVDVDLPTATAGVSRVVGRISSAGTIDTTTELTDASYSGDSIRSAISTNGVDIWLGGTSSTAANGGVRYTTLGSNSSIAVNTIPPSNMRVVKIFNNQLYVSTMTSSYRGVNTVGTGLPTTGGNSLTLLPGFDPSTTAPQDTYDFFYADANTLYLADNRAPASGGGIQKWTQSAGTWTQAYVMSTGLTTGLRGMTAKVQGATVTLYATTAVANPSAGNSIVVVTDTGAASAFSVLASCGANTWFKGIEFAPVGGGPAPCYANCDGVGGLTGNDFQCFLDAYVAGNTYANCDGVGGLTGNDFQCFLDKYVAGCS